MEVIIHDDESFQRPLKRFERRGEQAGIMSELRRHRHVATTSERGKGRQTTAPRTNRRRPVH